MNKNRTFASYPLFPLHFYLKHEIFKRKRLMQFFFSFAENGNWFHYTFENVMLLETIVQIRKSEFFCNASMILQTGRSNILAGKFQSEIWSIRQWHLQKILHVYTNCTQCKQRHVMPDCNHTTNGIPVCKRTPKGLPNLYLTIIMRGVRIYYGTGKAMS